jgi:hypothetical protein
MSLAKLFGKKEKKSAPKQDKAQETELMLDQKIKEQELRLNNIETRTNALQEEAKAKLKAGDKPGAKRILAKKKKLVDQMKQIEGAIAMMEEQKMTLESAGATKEIIDTLKYTNQIVKEAMKELNIESLEELKEEMEEAKAAQEELNNFFTDYANEQMDEVEDELKALEEEEAQKNKNAMPVANKEEINVEKKNKVNNEEFNLDNFLNS